jgi:hypothetical protein
VTIGTHSTSTSLLTRPVRVALAVAIVSILAAMSLLPSSNPSFLHHGIPFDQCAHFVNVTNERTLHLDSVSLLVQDRILFP